MIKLYKKSSIHIGKKSVVPGNKSCHTIKVYTGQSWNIDIKLIILKENLINYFNLASPLLLFIQVYFCLFYQHSKMKYCTNTLAHHSQWVILFMKLSMIYKNCYLYLMNTIIIFTILLWIICFWLSKCRVWFLLNFV